MTLFFQQHDDIAIRARRNGRSVMEQIQADANRRRKMMFEPNKQAIRAKLERQREIEQRIEAERKKQEERELEKKRRFRESWMRMVLTAQARAEGRERDVINVASPAKPRAFLKDIIREASDKTGIPVSVIKSAGKTQPVCNARFYISWRARRETQLSLPQIARQLGDRDHTTILHGVRRFQQALDRREQWAVMLAGVDR